MRPFHLLKNPKTQSSPLLSIIKTILTKKKVNNMTTADILNLVSLRNNIVTLIETYIEETNLSDDEIHDVISEITEKLNEIAPI